MSLPTPSAWTRGARCVLAPFGIGTIANVSFDSVLVRIDTPGMLIEPLTDGEFSARKIESGLEMDVPFEAVPTTIRPLSPGVKAEVLSQELHSRSAADPLPDTPEERVDALRQAFLGPLDVSVHWLRRFRASSVPLGSEERRALRILERLVIAELELARGITKW
jgi:hypothetical protein